MSGAGGGHLVFEDICHQGVARLAGPSQTDHVNKANLITCIRQ